MPGPTDFGFTMRPSRRDLLLVVAEDAGTRAAIVARLQEDGYSVLQAASAEEAVATLQMTHAAVVVSALRDRSAFAALSLPIVQVSEVERINDDVATALGSPS